MDYLLQSIGVDYANITFVDLDTEERTVVHPAISGNNILRVDFEQVPANRHFNLTIVASNSAGYAISNTTLSMLIFMAARSLYLLTLHNLRYK